ncbi:MAG: hypothetical protein IPF98_14835 [Gemmatimonadetes bacterium]|nr:hypothetical protein [Gemmatimonadota bacterium]
MVVDAASSGWQATFDLPWIDSWGARFSLGIDGLSLMMVLLTTLLMPLAVLGSDEHQRSVPRITG